MADDPNNFITGEVFIDDFHRGVITSMGGVPNQFENKDLQIVKGSMYVIKNIPRVEPPPGYEGVPVYLAYPDETIELKIMPGIVVRCDAITPALARWHLGGLQYTAPAPGAHQVTVTNPITSDVIATGFDLYEKRYQAIPYDLTYTIEIRARFRNNLKAESMRLLQYVMKRYKPYTKVSIFDSLNSLRHYDAFAESPTPVDIMPDVAGREANFNITLRVEGELDLDEPFLARSVINRPTVNVSYIKR